MLNTIVKTPPLTLYKPKFIVYNERDVSTIDLNDAYYSGFYEISQ